MRFRDLYVSRAELFSVGIEEESGDHYVSIPVSNRLVDYSEYYRIDADTFERHAGDLTGLRYVAEEARARLRDADLFLQPGTDRGFPNS